jgi:hypothetical protein
MLQHILYFVTHSVAYRTHRQKSHGTSCLTRTESLSIISHPISLYLISATTDKPWWSYDVGLIHFVGKYCTVLYFLLCPYCTVLTALCSSVACSSVLYSTALSLLLCTALYLSVSHCSAQCCAEYTVFWFAALPHLVLLTPTPLLSYLPFSLLSSPTVLSPHFLPTEIPSLSLLLSPHPIFSPISPPLPSPAGMSTEHDFRVGSEQHQW